MHQFKATTLNKELKSCTILFSVFIEKCRRFEYRRFSYRKIFLHAIYLFIIVCKIKLYAIELPDCIIFYFTKFPF